MRSIFFKEKSNFFESTWTEITEIIFSTLCKKFKIFLFILFEKSRLAQGIRRPKATDSPLPHLRARYRSQFLSETKNIADPYFSYSFLLLEPTKSGKKMKNSKFSQVLTKKVIYEAKKIVSTTCQTLLNIFC